MTFGKSEFVRDDELQIDDVYLANINVITLILEGVILQYYKMTFCLFFF